MKNTGLILALLLTSGAAASAQVKVQVLLDQNEFLVGEAIPVAVRVINHSGQTIHFGDEAWVTYSVEARDGFVVLKSGEAPMKHGFDVKTSEMATQEVDLAPYFTISKGGGYTVRATVRIKDWEMELTSGPKSFDVIRGTKLWEQDFGVPRPPGESRGAPEARKYSLQRATYLKHTRLYLRVTDPSEAKVFKVIQVGPVVSFSRPRTQLDTRNNLHLLYEDGARSFDYSVFSPDGDTLVRQTYFYNDNGPRLMMDESGKIMIVGGVRQPSSNDLPARTPTLSNDVPPPKTP